MPGAVRRIEFWKEIDTVTVTTTHLKVGWIRRDGIPRSDKATVAEHIMRQASKK